MTLEFVFFVLVCAEAMVLLVFAVARVNDFESRLSALEQQRVEEQAK